MVGMAKARDAVLRSKVTRLQHALSATDTSHTHLTEIADGMVGQFGGVTNFCKAWKYSIDCSKPGTKVANDAMHAVAKLIAVSTRLQQDKTRAEQMTEEELVKELTALLVNHAATPDGDIVDV